MEKYSKKNIVSMLYKMAKEDKSQWENNTLSSFLKHLQRGLKNMKDII